MKTIIGKLKKNPIFLMSLGSKELFHSNFLEFLWRVDKSKFIQMICDLTNRSCSFPSSCEMSREKENFDICIFHKNSNKYMYDLIIENKVKSIPRKDQLDNYELKAKGRGTTSFLLLSLVEHFPCKSSIPKWIIVNYLDLAISIKKHFSSGLAPSHKQYIDDYVYFIEAMHVAQEKMTDNFMSQVYFDKGILEDLKEIRIHDLYIKLRGSMFLSYLEGKIIGAAVKIMPFNKSKNSPFKYDDIRSVSTGQTNVYLECTIQQGVGMVAAYIYKKRGVDFIYEIAIQGNQYRHGINSRALSDPNDPKLMKVWNGVRKNQYNAIFFDNIAVIGQKNVPSLPHSNYYKYWPEYVYKYVIINCRIVSELIDSMANDINKIVQDLNNGII